MGSNEKQVSSVEGGKNSVVFLLARLARPIAREPLRLETRNQMRIEAKP